MTASPTLDELLALLDMAWNARLGIEIRTSDPLGLKAKLYAARAKAGEADWSRLQIRTSPWPERSDLVIVKGQPAPAEGRGENALAKLIDGEI